MPSYLQRVRMYWVHGYVRSSTLKDFCMCATGSVGASYVVVGVTCVPSSYVCTSGSFICVTVAASYVWQWQWQLHMYVPVAMGASYLCQWQWQLHMNVPVAVAASCVSLAVAIFICATVSGSFVCVPLVVVVKPQRVYTILLITIYVPSLSSEWREKEAHLNSVAQSRWP